MLAADDLTDVERVVGEVVELGDQTGALGGARGVVVDRLVQREGNLGDGVHAVRMPFSTPSQPMADRTVALDVS